MGLPVEQRRRLTIAEYLQMEQASQEKHELCDGEVLDMAGGTVNHATIAGNAYARIHLMLVGKPCRIYGSDLRVRIPRKTFYMYPDMSIVCGKAQTDPDDPSNSSVVNPKVVIEVLSPSTEAYDRGGKFSRYRELESLEEYVLVSQESARVEVFLRRENGTWLLTPIQGLDRSMRLQSVDVSIPLAEIYAGVEPPPEQD